MKKATRILVANRPKLMRDVVLAALADQPGLEIVGEVSDEAEILTQVRDTRPDLLVIALDDTEQRDGQGFAPRLAGRSRELDRRIFPQAVSRFTG